MGAFYMQVDKTAQNGDIVWVRGPKWLVGGAYQLSGFRQKTHTGYSRKKAHLPFAS